MTWRLPLGVSIPQTFFGDRFEPRRIRDYLERAEALSFENAWVAIDSNRSRAARRLAQWFQAFYETPDVAERVAVCGGPGECVDRLREIIAAGAQFLVLNPVFDELEHLERLAAEIAPPTSRGSQAGARSGLGSCGAGSGWRGRGGVARRL